MRKNLYLLICLFGLFQSTAQSPRTVIVEHFTNSVCSICASKNPAFYNTLSGYPQVLHIAFYPSSPYNYCFFSVQNKQENDDRTKYYGAYGATPQVAVNGHLLPISTPAITNTTLDSVLEQTSPVEIRAFETEVGPDSVNVTVIIKTTAANSVSDARLFAGVVENPINKTTQNGETVHYDVFRKALTVVTGDVISLPGLNDSTIYQLGYRIKDNWQANNLYSMVFIQRADTKEILNGAKSGRVVATDIERAEVEKVVLFPNPVMDKLYFPGIKAGGQSYSIFDIAGKKLLEGELEVSGIDMKDIAPGIYFLRTGSSVIKFIRQ